VNKLSILVVFLCFGFFFTHAQEDSTNTQLEIFECYDRYSLKDQWAQVVDLVSIISKDNPIDMTKLIEATGDYPFAYVKQENMHLFDSLVNLTEVKYLLPSNLKFYWSLKSEDHYWGKNYYSVHAIKLSDHGTSVLNARCIEKAEAGYSKVNETDIVTITMTPEGTKLWTKITTENLGKALAIIMNDKVFSAPKVYSAITDSQTEISGRFSKEEAEEYAKEINAAIKQSAKND
jgi:preprotein translocase subunit SecD